MARRVRGQHDPHNAREHPSGAEATSVRRPPRRRCAGPTAGVRPLHHHAPRAPRARLLLGHAQRHVCHRCHAPVVRAAAGLHWAWVCRPAPCAQCACVPEHDRTMYLYRHRRRILRDRWIEGYRATSVAGSRESRRRPIRVCSNVRHCSNA
jgi:hypothetical protein